jgi:hypothetical protein
MFPFRLGQAVSGKQAALGWGKQGVAPEVFPNPQSLGEGDVAQVPTDRAEGGMGLAAAFNVRQVRRQGQGVLAAGVEIGSELSANLIRAEMGPGGRGGRWGGSGTQGHNGATG